MGKPTSRCRVGPDAVTGPGGLLRARLAARITSGELGGGTAWPVAVLTPGSRPLTAGDTVIPAALGDPPTTLAGGADNGGLPDDSRPHARPRHPTVDSAILATAHAGYILTWDNGIDNAAATLCENVTDPITPAEWNHHFSGIEYRPPCP